MACERAVPPSDETENAPITIENVPAVDDPFAPAVTDETAPSQPDESETVPGEDTPPADTPPDGEAVDPPASSEPETDPAPSTPPTQAGGTYTVQAGDTLFAIAQRYNLTVAELASANNITNINRLSVGEVLTIPGAGAAAPPATGEERVHIVQRGENLFRIALQYGFTVNELVNYNNITNPARIDVGQEIRIPANP